MPSSAREKKNNTKIKNRESFPQRNASPLILSLPIDARKYMFIRLKTLPDCLQSQVTVTVSAI